MLLTNLIIEMICSYSYLFTLFRFNNPTTANIKQTALCITCNCAKAGWMPNGLFCDSTEILKNRTAEEVNSTIYCEAGPAVFVANEDASVR